MAEDGHSDVAGGALRPVEFSTDGTPPTDRFELWRAQFGAVHDVEVEAGDRSGFEARGRNWRFGPVLVGVFDTPARRVIRTAKHRRRDDLDQVVLRVLRSGVIRSRSSLGTVKLTPGEIGLGSYASTYEEDQAAGEWVTAIFPRDAFPALFGCSPTSRILKGASAALLADFLLSLAARLDGLPRSEAPHVARIVNAMIAACLAGSALDDTVPARERELVLRERVERIIAAHIASPRLTPGRIAGLAGISRSALYRAYEEEGGIAARVLDHRLELVWRDLTSPDLAHLPIGKLAERRGLYNAASFHRAFRRRFGETPGEVRSSAARAERDQPADVPLPQGSLRFIDLLRPGTEGQPW